MIELREITKRFGERVALDGVSIVVRPGTVQVLLGSSGSGKSTVLRVILGLVRPDAGEVLVGGTAVTEATRGAVVQGIGYVVQDGGLFPHLTALGNVALPAHVHGWPPARVRERAAELGAMVGLDAGTLALYPRELSGGQRQRVGLMRALMLDPPILLLDEPLGALDPIVRAELQTQLGSLFATLGKTVLLVTHDIREAALLGERIALMKAGRVIQQGTFADLRERPATPFVTQFLTAQTMAADSRKDR
ncbi:MAG TPA: ATP-binding cassette domain-containing protein [Candidatus Bathyarchaeia archaeon]|nr:ATP-binding cassette domain-containing protein [Candidatus Bathyarchaeia archaeon]